MNAKERAHHLNGVSLKIAALKARIARAESKTKATAQARFTMAQQVQAAKAGQTARREAELLDGMPVEDTSALDAMEKNIATMEADLATLAKATQQMTAELAAAIAEEASATVALATADHAECAAAFMDELAALYGTHWKRLAELQWYLKATPQNVFLRTIEGPGNPQGAPRWRMDFGADLPSPSTITEASAKAMFAARLAELLTEDVKDDAPSAEAEPTDEASDTSTDDDTEPK